MEKSFYLEKLAPDFSCVNKYPKKGHFIIIKNTTEDKPPLCPPALCIVSNQDFNLVGVFCVLCYEWDAIVKEVVS